MVSITNSKRSTMETDLSGSSISNLDQEELLKSAKAKMGEVRKENERLKKMLAQIVLDYKSLEKQITLINQTNTNKERTKNNYMDDDGQDHELVSLTLGSWTSSNNKKNKYNYGNNDNTKDWNKRRKIDEGLKLGLDCEFEYNNMNNNVKSHNNNNLMKNSSLDYCNEAKDNENMGTWSSSSGSLKPQEKTTKEGDDENLHQLPVKKTRVCIRSRCDTPTMHDGCQWRKYGQKIAKGNPCPRAYYRCTVSPTCPVRKQVQRCAEDMSILITTYEGTHNHPLPLSATAMASATTAAASMIKTGPLTSQPPLMGPTTTTSTSSSLNNNNFHNTSPSPTMMTNTNHLNRSLLNIIPLNHQSMISSSSHSHPTITLDLTTPNPTGPPPFHNNLTISKNNTNNNIIPSYSSFLNFSSTCFDFSSKMSAPWPNSYFNNGTLFANSNNNYLQQVTSNPNFRSVLAAAISSYVGNSTNSNNSNKDIDFGVKNGNDC